MKIWQKGDITQTDLSNKVSEFTVGEDKVLDILLAPYDIEGSIAHVKMLASVGLIDPETEMPSLVKALEELLTIAKEGKLTIGEGTEDIHSEVEFRLTELLGDMGKKIHSGRSRNDQILLDMKLFTRAEILIIAQKTKTLFDTLITLSEKHKDVLLPGYTHLQIAMLSSFGLWFGAYAESLVDDMHQMGAAFTIANKNPLGSGAGYGVSLPLDRQLTTDLLGFENLNVNVVYAQMNRGKLERVTSSALASLAATLSRMAMDMCLYMSQNFGFVSFPEELTTGSSIMPHKKNPDVWELIRAKCNRIQALPQQMNMICTNLPSGYHRDMQELKALYLPMFEQIKKCLEMSILMLENIAINTTILDDNMYNYLYSVELVNEKVLQGMAFRDAYVAVGKQIQENKFTRPVQLHHNHIGSIGNLCNDRIIKMMNDALDWTQGD